MTNDKQERRRHAGNCELRMTGFDDRDLADVVRLAFGDRKAVAYRVDAERLTFDAYTGANGWVRLPAPLDADAVLPMVRAWLSEAVCGPQPRHDGSNTKGWTVSGGTWENFCTIAPAWAEHHK